MQDSGVFAEGERFIHGLPTEGAVRPVILDSWTRCLRAGVAAEAASVTLGREVSPQAVGDALQDKIASMDKTLDQTVTVIQRIAAHLRPAVLDDLGLVAAIEWQANAFRSRIGIRCDVIIETDDPRIDSEQATALASDLSRSPHECRSARSCDLCHRSAQQHPGSSPDRDRGRRRGRSYRETH